MFIPVRAPQCQENVVSFEMASEPRIRLKFTGIEEKWSFSPFEEKIFQTYLPLIVLLRLVQFFF